MILHFMFYRCLHVLFYEYIENNCMRTNNIGALAQLGERQLCKLEVIGSIPIGSTKILQIKDLEINDLVYGIWCGDKDWICDESKKILQREVTNCLLKR